MKYDTGDVVRYCHYTGCTCLGRVICQGEKLTALCLGDYLGLGVYSRYDADKTAFVKNSEILDKVEN